MSNVFEPIPSPPVAVRRAPLWVGAAVTVAFIGVMLLAVEVLVAWIVGSMLGSVAVEWGLGLVFVLPTLHWLFGSCLRNALSAERDAFGG